MHSPFYGAHIFRPVLGRLTKCALKVIMLQMKYFSDHRAVLETASFLKPMSELGLHLAIFELSKTTLLQTARYADSTTSVTFCVPTTAKPLKETSTMFYVDDQSVLLMINVVS